jgi:hypothetical protein
VVTRSEWKFLEQLGILTMVGFGAAAGCIVNLDEVTDDAANLESAARRLPRSSRRTVSSHTEYLQRIDKAGRRQRCHLDAADTLRAADHSTRLSTRLLYQYIAGIEHCNVCVVRLQYGPEIASLMKWNDVILAINSCIKVAN